MALVRWQPFREIEEVQREMNRLFDEVMTPSNRRDGVEAAFAPAIELEETPDSYQLRLEVPGMEPDDINIEATAEAVSISGERKSRQKLKTTASPAQSFATVGSNGSFHCRVGLPTNRCLLNIKM